MDTYADMARFVQANRAALDRLQASLQEARQHAPPAKREDGTEPASDAQAMPPAAPASGIASAS